ARIKEICAREGYRANTLARSLISNQTNVLGLVVPDISKPFYAEVAYSVETYARRHGYNVMLCNSQDDEKQLTDLFDFLLGHQADGIILLSADDQTCDYVAKYLGTVPLVLLEDSLPESYLGRCSAVSLDNDAAGRMAIGHLNDLGHQKICYLGHRSNNSTHQIRFQGAQKEAAARGIDLTVLENPMNTSTIEAGYALAKEYFASPFEATAIFAANDSLALGVMQAAEEAGVRIPEDLSLLGFDNTTYADLPRVKLSTIDHCKQKLAETSVDLLLQIINSDRSAKDIEYVHEIVQPALVERKTCATPKK
ncbi:MAG: LacI family DNA-binding transcriptional regulator, partial [Butyricicoccus sp.]|nr:LacI family DNA-binding transcriptional regulator [Butyricicoccus sp.]